MKESIIRLRALEKQRFAYRYALNVVDFDAETVAPEGSADGRAEACEVLSRADFDLLVNDNTAALLRQAAQDAETEQERAEVRELQRAYDQISKIPADEYAAFTKLTQQSTPAWVKAKRTNDFSVFAPYLEKIVAARRAQAHYFAPDRDPYEVLLDQYEHGLTIAQCDEFFAPFNQAMAIAAMLFSIFIFTGTPSSISLIVSFGVTKSKMICPFPIRIFSAWKSPSSRE